MWTAVVGGSIHRADTRSSAASDQRSPIAMASQRRMEGKESLRCEGLAGVIGLGVTSSG